MRVSKPEAHAMVLMSVIPGIGVKIYWLRARPGCVTVIILYLTTTCVQITKEFSFLEMQMTSNMFLFSEGVAAM